MSKLVIYQKPTCTTCRQLYRMLRAKGVDFEAIDYYIKPLTRSKLNELLKKMGMSAEELLRKKEPIYRTLKLAGKRLSHDKIIRLMVQYPDLMQRPIVEKGARAILARPAERIKEIL